MQGNLIEAVEHSRSQSYACQSVESNNRPSLPPSIFKDPGARSRDVVVQHQSDRSCSSAFQMSRREHQFESHRDHTIESSNNRQTVNLVKIKSLHSYFDEANQIPKKVRNVLILFSMIMFLFDAECYKIAPVSNTPRCIIESIQLFVLCKFKVL